MHIASWHVREPTQVCSFISSGCRAGGSSQPTASRQCHRPDLPWSCLRWHSPCEEGDGKKRQLDYLLFTCAFKIPTDWGVGIMTLYLVMNLTNIYIRRLKAIICFSIYFMWIFLKVKTKSHESRVSLLLQHHFRLTCNILQWAAGSQEWRCSRWWCRLPLLGSW